MRIIDTNGKMLVADNHPSILVGTKNYIVDDRKSTFDKIQALQNDKTLKEDERDLKIISELSFKHIS